MRLFRLSGCVLLSAVMLSSVELMAAGSVPQGEPSYTAAREVHHDTSRPMRDIIADLAPSAPVNPADYVVPNQFLDLDDLIVSPPGAASPRQQLRLSAPMPAVDLAVDGMRIGLGGGGVPPDTTGDIGPDHYFQWVNTSWALFSKTTGALVSGPTPGNSFFSGFGGLCETTDRGDPLVLWDDHAQRWIVSQFAFNSTSNPPWYQCVAISATADPLGSYHRYAFQYPNFNDYGKMGVWLTEDGGQNAYLFSMHEFNGSFQGASFSVVERDKMLAGESAQFIRFGGLNAYGAIPFHLEGEFPLPAGMCPVFVHFSSSTAAYQLWDLCVDWADGSASFNPTPTLLASEPFTLGLSGIPQKDSTTRLDDFGGNTMYLAALRAYGPTGPAAAQGVINHAVDVGNDQAGARWVQFGLSSGAAEVVAPDPEEFFNDGFETVHLEVISQKRITDQGTYAPDAASRWMGGVNIDQSGNMAFGYNVSSASMNPEIRIAGRLRTDPAGALRDETQCSTTNTGAQTGLFSGRARWGDYATMGVDPVDQCTFWFTNEYYSTTSSSGWNTRICSLSFAECGDADFVLETTPSSLIPVCGEDAVVSVRAGEFGSLGSNVVLSEGIVPGGVSLSFDPLSIAPAQSSEITINGSASLADGVYNVEVLGVANALNRQANFEIGVSASVPGAPGLLSPVNAGTGIVTRPTFTWAADATAVEYLIEVAADAGFTQVVDSAVVEGADYVSNVLLSNESTYFWRVTPMNYCGDGAASATYSFTTGVPGDCPSGTTPFAVFSDDFNGGGVAWTTENAQGPGGANWTNVVPPAGTGLNTLAWWAANATSPADQRLISPVVVLPLSDLPLVLAFDTFHQYEVNGPANCYDGGFVEISTDGSIWTPLGDSRNLADPYLGVLTTSSDNPAGGNSAWCRQPPGGNPVQAVFLLNEFAGESIQLRFRSSADANTVGPAPAGWGVDNVLVQSCPAD